MDTWLVKVAACPTCRTPVRLLNSGDLGSSALDIQSSEDDAMRFRTCGGRSSALRIS